MHLDGILKNEESNVRTTTTDAHEDRFSSEQISSFIDTKLSNHIFAQEQQCIVTKF